MKYIKGIRKGELGWHEFKSIFGKKYFSKGYYDSKSKELYELKMGCMTDEEYTTKFLELLRYVPYTKDEKMKVQIFFSGFPLAFKG